MALRGGRYETLREIASGGMAKVHLGRALGAGGFERLVAIKAMHAHLVGEPEFVDMFLDEARLAARIRHPNVVGTIDVQQDEEGIFLVMEYVEGPPLSAIVRERRRTSGSVPIDVALRIFLDTLAGLHAAHELVDSGGEPLRLVHRDVSPQNILVGVDGIARITDFGIARAESRLASTRGDQVKGKVPFMAPEQIRAQPIDRRTDVYAAGAVLWELLTGERLVRGETDAERIMQIMSGPPRSPRDVNPLVAEPLAEACQKALRSSPDERFPTTAAFAEAIEAAALASGVTVATARVVSTFVKALNLHESPTDLPSSSPLAARSAPHAPPSTKAKSASSTSADPESSSTHVSAVIPSEREPGARSSSVAPLAIGGAGMLAVVLAGVFFLQRSSAPQSQPLAAPALTAAEASPAPSPLFAPTPKVALPTAAPASTAAPTAAPLPAPRPSATLPKPVVVKSPKDASKPDAGRARSATKFRPKEL
jgi:serine/threonine protein kinase